MKIITQDTAYIQKNDIAILNASGQNIPANIMQKIFSNGMVIVDDSNRFEYYTFTEPEEIEYFKSLDWIADYDTIMDLSEADILEIAQSLFDKKRKIAEDFNAMSLDERKNHHEMIDEAEIIGLKISSLRDALWFKQGHLVMPLPEEIKVKKKGIKGLIKSMFNKNKLGE